MKKTRGKGLMAAGTALLLAALSLTLYNWNQNIQAGKAAQEILTELKEKMPEPHLETAGRDVLDGFAAPSTTEEDGTAALPGETMLPPAEDLIAEYLPDEIVQETVWWIDGDAYLGTISIPALGLELPVLSEWSYPNLRAAPCRYAGSVAEGNLILAAHNYNSHFGLISGLNSGDEIFFTDGEGVVHTYTVVQTEWIDGYDSGSMLQGDEEWDLTLFTCTLSGLSRVTVRAVSQDN